MNPYLNMKIFTQTPRDLHAPPPPSPEMKQAVAAVEMIVSYAFKNKRLLEEALTHPSHSDAVSYQRLEFVGDAVLSLAVSNYLFLAYPRIDQGNLSMLRSANVSTEKLARVSVRHGLFRFLRHSAPVLDDKVREFTEVVSGEEEMPLVYRGSVKAPKVLADIVESVAAAIYVDLNFDLEKLWMIFRHVLEPIVTLEDLQQQPQPVTKLFEVCQKHGKHVDIKYWRDETKSIASVYVDGKFVASGSSEQKEVAKVNAAEIALYKLSKLMRIDDVSIEVIAGIDGSFHIEGAKHKLHELCGKKKWPKPIYNINQDKGSSHEKKFVSTVQIATIDGVLCMTGDEMSRVKDAENSAASLMIRALQESDYV
ncbi:putative ribonuclease III [Rosa chinensis]|uniref:Putative ribonuclease III n=1 Tax=Rosa chinensis TaxID=74649 RepID=A0A2P6QCN3_ROSCH|nr:ribonuclease 3-like protein 2 [Rosa chinensis]PRQ31940.1 putative ribonuclease III [Rosa chinensis]